jgi:hypothetical protein
MYFLKNNKIVKKNSDISRNFKTHLDGNFWLEEVGMLGDKRTYGSST